MTEPQMTYAQVAALTNRSVSTIEKWVRNDLIPYHRIGRNIRFDEAEIRKWMDDHDLTADNRVVPVRPLKRRYGVQYVYPSDTLGDEEHCWCGEPVDHEWPGKEHGAPHPHEHERTQQVVIVEQPTTTHPEWRRIERTDMRGFHAVLKDFLVKCINTDGLGWRATNNSILLYPPDGSQPITVYCRNTDQQMRQLNTWYAAHVEPSVRPTEADVRRLVETVNNPDEHPARDPEPETEWQTYITTEGEPSEFFETNGVVVRCKVCVGTPSDYTTPVTNLTGLGGHIRMLHRPTENMRTPEALAKATDSKRYNRLHEKVVAAVELLAETVGYDAGSRADLIRVNERLQRDLERERQRADDAEARIQLMQEVFRGLE